MTTSTLRKIRIGTRTSKLALWQTNHVIQTLQEARPGLVCETQNFVTQGDKTLDRALPQIGGKGLFTAELERALIDGDIDIAVHSLKDLPIEDAPGLTLGAISSRADVRDALVAREGWTLETLPHGAVVGTSSIRRQAQLLARRPDLIIKPIRGNVDTRIRKVRAGEYDAAVLAAAGLTRLGLTEMVTEWLDLDTMLPAPGQGALAVQCRAGDKSTLEILSAIEDPDVRRAVNAERSFLHGLGGGCSAPVGAYATVNGTGLHLNALIAWPHGKVILRADGSGDDALALGAHLAQQVIGRGAAEILASLNEDNAPKPLAGKKIVVTRALAQADVLSRKLAVLGATPVEIPMISIAPMVDTESSDQATQSLEYYDWVIFTSVNGVEMFWERLLANLEKFRSGAGELPDPGTMLPQVATVGPATAKALLERGRQPDFTPEEFVGEAVAAGMGDLAGKRILLPRAEIARPALPQLLEAQGAVVDDLPVYRTLPAEIDPVARTQIEQGVDVITFTSGSTVKAWVEAIGPLTPAPLVACIGPVTAEVALDLGLTPDIVAADYTTDGLVQALVEFFQK